MSKNFQVILILLLAVALIAVIFIFSWYVMSSTTADPAADETGEQNLTAEELEALSVDTEPITTNLYNNDYIIIQFNMLLNSEQAKEELERRMSEVRAEVISVLSSKEPDDFRGGEGEKVEELLQDRLSDILQEGEVERVLTIDRQIQ